MTQSTDKLATELLSMYSRSVLVELRDEMAAHSEMISRAMQADVRDGASYSQTWMSEANNIKSGMEMVAFYLGTLIERMENLPSIEEEETARRM
jgi:hypothetical protein